MSIPSLNHSMVAENLDFYAGSPMIYHCHHFNLFLDQTIDDALGPVAGLELRTEAARQSSRQLLLGVMANADVRTPAERLALAQEVFGAFGHGRLRIDADADGGSAEGEFLHYGHSWHEKYGKVVRRRTTADAFAAGFAAAAVEVAFGTDVGFKATETACVARGDERCVFELVPDPSLAGVPLLSIDNTRANPPTGGIQEERIVAITNGLREFLSGVAGDDRGLVQAFGVYVTRHLTNYYNTISYAAVDKVASRSEALVPMVEGLLRESGHVCVFYTFGGILYSPEWDGLVGRVEGGLEEVVSSCCAISRALGFGSWSIKELSESRLVIQTGSEYESPYCSVAGRSIAGQSYFLQGAALAFMRLWEAVDWQDRPDLDQQLYDQLFKSGTQWKVEQTQSLCSGDPVSEVVVTRV